MAGGPQGGSHAKNLEPRQAASATLAKRHRWSRKCERTDWMAMRVLLEVN